MKWLFLCVSTLCLTCFQAQAVGDPDVSISNAAELTEANTSMPFTVTLSFSQPVATDITWTTVSQTATAGSDFTAASGTLTIPANETTGFINISILDDSVNEATETFTVELLSADNAIIVDHSGTGTINDDDPLPIASVFDSQTSEADTMVFGVVLDRPSGQQITVNYATLAGTATAADFTGVSGTLTFVPGEVYKQIDVAINDDEIDEPDETFFMFLVDGENADPGDTDATGLIEDNDPTPQISITDETTTEGSSLVFTVTLSNPSSRTVTVDYATQLDGTAASDDITEATGTLSFAPESTATTFAIDTTSDTTDEDDETFSVALSAAEFATIGDDTADALIEDDDDPPVVNVNSPSYTEAEAFDFAVTLSEFSGKTLSVTVTPVMDTATVADFVNPQPKTLTFLPGETSKTYSMDPRDDLYDEATETFTVELSDPVNVTLGSNGTGTLLDNDVPEITIADRQVNERHSGTQVVVFYLRMYPPSRRTVEVDWTINGVTATADADFEAESGTVTFQPGSTQSNLRVMVIGDLLNETDETAHVLLTSAGIGVDDQQGDVEIAVGAEVEIADDTAVLTILDDDEVPSLSIADVTVDEDVGNAIVTLSLNTPSGQDVTATYTTSNVTTTDSDYTGTSSQVIVPENSGSTTIAIPINDDELLEQTERFLVTLSGVSNATVAKDVATVAILDNEPANNLVYRLHVSGEAVLDGTQQGRARSHGLAYLVVDPDRGTATALYWLYFQRQRYPIIQEWTEDGVAVGFPDDGEDGGTQFLGSFSIEGDVSAYRSKYLVGERLFVDREIGNGRQITVAPRLSGTARFGTAGFGDVGSSQEVESEGFDLLNLNFSARWNQRKTRQQNAGDRTFDEVVASLKEELGMPEGLALTATGVEQVEEADPFIAIYNLHWLATEEDSGRELTNRWRGYLVMHSDLSEAYLILYGVVEGRRFVSILSTDQLGLPFYQQVVNITSFGFVDATEPNQGRPGNAASHIWSGQAPRRPLFVGADTDSLLPLRLGGEQVIVNLRLDPDDDVVVRGPSRLRLNVRQTRNANQFGYTIDETIQVLIDQLAARGFEPLF